MAEASTVNPTFEINTYVRVNDNTMMYGPAYLATIGIPEPIGRITDLYPGAGDEMVKVTFETPHGQYHEVYWLDELESATGRICNQPATEVVDGILLCDDCFDLLLKNGVIEQRPLLNQLWVTTCDLLRDVWRYLCTIRNV